MGSSVFTKRILQFVPPWFRGPFGTTLLKAAAGPLDDYANIVFAGRRNGIPYAGGAKDPRAPRGEGVLLECEEDALAYHARDRGIRLYDTEPLLSKRYRLSIWRQLKKLRGSHVGELLNLQPFWMSTPDAVLPWMRIVFQDRRSIGRSGNWTTLSPTGLVTVKRTQPTNWNYDGQTTKRTRFWVIIYLPAGYSTAITYDDGVSVYDGGAIYDGVTAIAVADIVAAIKEAKSAHSHLAGVIVTSMQPTEGIPGHLTHFPFDPADAAFTDAAGWTSHPTGNWGTIIDPVTHLPTRPPYGTWVFEDN